ncbi:MAG: LTA synthase family protein [Ferruginibacter sp.]
MAQIILKYTWFVFRFTLTWVVIFFFARLAFLLSNTRQVSEAGVGESCKSLWYGLKMDASMASYLTIPVILLLLSGIIIPVFRKPVFFKIYTGILVVVITLMVLADAGIYQAWGNRLDATPLKYLAHPKEAFASISNLPLAWIAIVFIIVLLIGIKLFNRFFEQKRTLIENPKHRLGLAVSLILLAGLYVIPIRGGFQLAPMNQSAVYFSQSNFANQAAINAPWNFIYALRHNKDNGKNPYNFLPEAQASMIVKELYASEGRTRQILRDTTSPVNLVFIVWESLTSKIVNLDYESKPVTPGLNKLSRESIYFSDIYASGDRTDKGIVAVLSGYPAQPVTSIVKIPTKAASLPMLSKELSKAGYKNYFYYGGELEFANIKAYLLQGNFSRFISIADFEGKDQNSKWGAHDGVVGERLAKDIHNFTAPFFCTWLTLSSHEPFEVPVPKYYNGDDEEHKFLNAHHYTDSCVAGFISFAKQQTWWKNTMVVIVADHGHRIPHKATKEDDYKIPLLILGGAIKDTVEINTAGSQTDIAATIWAQLSKNKNPFTWSKNLLDSSIHHWGYFSFTDGFGFSTTSSAFIYDNVGNRFIEKRGAVTDTMLNYGKSLLQKIMDDYYLR